MKQWRVPVDDRGMFLTVCEWGEESARPVVLVHGFLDQGAAWEAVAATLPYRLVAPDLRGHGLSAHVGAGGWYHFWDYLADVDAVVRQLGGQVDLVGHSMGSTLCALYAGLVPDAVRRLVLVEGLGPPDESRTPLQRPRDFVTHLRERPKHGVLDGIADAAQRMRRQIPGLDADRALVLAERASRQTTPADPGHAPGKRLWTWDALHRARAPQVFHESAFLPVLAEIKAPTLVVWGDRSPVIAWAGTVAEREACIRNLRKATLSGGHHLHHEQPAALAGLIREHLELP